MARFPGGTAVEVTNTGASEAVPVDIVAGSIEVALGANVGLLNILNAVIDPATEQKQDDGITLLGTIDADTSKIPSQGTAVMAASTPMTLATNDTQFGSVGAAADPDGNVHGQLRSVAEESLATNTNAGLIADAAVVAGATGTLSAKMRRMTTDLGTMDADTGNMALALGATSDAASTAGGVGSVPAQLRRLTTDLDAVNTKLAAIEGALGGGLAPDIDSYTVAQINASAATANQEVIATPGANKQIHVMLWLGSADTADGSISWQDDADAPQSAVMETLQGLIVGAKSDNASFPVMKLATNKALEIDTVTCGFKGTIGYNIVNV